MTGGELLALADRDLDDRERQSLERVLGLINAIPSDRPDDAHEIISIGALRLLSRALATPINTVEEGES